MQKQFFRNSLLETKHRTQKATTTTTTTMVLPEQMLSIGLHFVGFDIARTQHVIIERNEDRFVYMFGALSDVFSIIFRDIQDADISPNTAINKANPKHFLMCLYWLKRFQVETTITGIDL